MFAVLKRLEAAGSGWKRGRSETQEWGPSEIRKRENRSTGEVEIIVPETAGFAYQKQGF